MLRDLNRLVGERKAALLAAAAAAPDTVYGVVAPIWQGLLASRPNLLTADQFALFRCPSVSATYGVGSHRDSDEVARLFDQSVAELVDAQGIPADVIAAISEPVLGAPVTRPYRDNLFSTVFLNNIATAWRVRSLAQKFGLGGRPLRVCEIGAGFGAGALILHQLLEIESYTVIDLPENLYLSSLFLPLSLPGRTHAVVDPAQPETLACKSQLNFTLPGFIDTLAGPAFDLVVNRASLGEMTLATARGYITWIESRLSDHGLFYFGNRFNTPDAMGAKRLSDYGLQRMDIRHLRPVERTTRPNNQIHCEIAASRATSATTPRDPAHLDAIGELIACGFDPQITAFIDAPAKDVAAVAGPVNAAFAAPSLDAKEAVLRGADFGRFADIAIVLSAIIALLGDKPADKDRVLGMDLGVKLEVRLRSLFAETERRRGDANWTATLRPLDRLAPSLRQMAELSIGSGRQVFAGAFRRDLRL